MHAFRSLPLLILLRTLALFATTLPGLATSQVVGEYGVADYEPKPGTPFQVGILEGLRGLPGAARFDRTIRLRMSPELVAAFHRASSVGASRETITSWWITPGVLEVTVACTNGQSAVFTSSPLDLVYLEFRALPRTRRLFVSIESVRLTSGGRPLPAHVVCGAATFDIAPLAIAPSLPPGEADHYYLGWLRSSHAAGDVRWSAVNPQSLPPGFVVTSWGMVRGPLAAVGTYAIEVEATDGVDTVRKSVSLSVINSPPEIQSALFYDTDGSRTVNAGDVIRLRLNDPVQLDPHDWQSALKPSRKGDRFGRGATLSMQPDEAREILVLTLGRDPVLDALGAGSGITSVPTANPIIRDRLGAPLRRKTVALRRPAADMEPLRNLIVGRPMPTIVLNAPPFAPVAYTATRLPPGLTITNAPSGASTISGTPTTADIGLMALHHDGISSTHSCHVLPPRRPARARP